MARTCSVCGKRPVTGLQVSHSHHKTKRKWLPNLQTITIMVKGKNKRVKICTKCLKRRKRK